VGARFLLCCIYTQVHAVTMVTWWEGGNHQDLFLRVYRCVHTDLLEFQSAQKTKFFFIFWAFYFSFTRSFDLSNVHRHIWVGSPLGHSLRYTPPFFWNRIGNLSTFITEKESSRNVDLVSKNFKFLKRLPPAPLFD
jgi:hypothetical protein